MTPNDGPIDTYSEEWRRICEARHVMKLEKEKRREYYQKVAENRGREAAQELKDEVNRQWEAQA